MLKICISSSAKGFSWNGVVWNHRQERRSNWVKQGKGNTTLTTLSLTNVKSFWLFSPNLMEVLTPVRMQKCTSEVEHGNCSSEVTVKMQRRILLLSWVLPSDVHKPSNILQGVSMVESSLWWWNNSTYSCPSEMEMIPFIYALPWQLLSRVPFTALNPQPLQHSHEVSHQLLRSSTCTAWPSFVHGAYSDPTWCLARARRYHRTSLTGSRPWK